MITHPSMTEQIGHVLEAEIIIEMIPPISEDNNEGRAGSSSPHKIFVAAVYKQTWHIRGVNDIDDDKVDVFNSCLE